MYLKINDIDKSLISFSQTTDKIIFVFAENISSESFADISVVKLYSDDNMFLTEYTLEDYDIKIYYTEINEFSNNELDYFKDNFGFDGGTPITMFIKDGKEGTTGSRIEGDVSMEKIVSKLKTNGFIK